ncbi:hypothetical protein DSCW_50440 [Desulfosarcina widdelii]|uniref:DUF3786 domain-containing protein n=1 Tax=Desulfosarcina widdelii TaxID=947919 RepID=A0A5K7ZN84_9BACT|nr:DUF3786 domain-containing protein [Desulfosarcina widdelii]BBO77627.1 hypothetical protein DSCW_50440 [Desulfosarcina widdelii]
MTERAPVFDKIIADYLQQVAALEDRACLSDTLGIDATQDGFTVPLFNQSITVTQDGIFNENNEPPSHAASVLVCKYLLLCPDTPQTDHTLVTYKDFKDAAPYVGGFKNTVEIPIARAFSGRLDKLEAACLALGGRPFDTDVSCHLAYEFQALHRVPIVLIFHDADEDFPAQCTVLLRKNAAGYLDMECLAMIGGILAHRLQK